MQARTDQRFVPANQGAMPGNANNFGLVGSVPIHYGQVYGQQTTKDSALQHLNLANSPDGLASAFPGSNLNGLGSAGSLSCTSGPNMTNTASLNNGQQLYYQLPDGRLLVSSVNGSTGSYQQAGGAYSVTPAQAQYLQQTSYHVNNSTVPQDSSWMSARQVSAEIPDLAAARRSSWSSTEETGPHTPFFGARGQPDYATKINVTDQSPNPWSTPSPEQIGQAFYPQQLAKTANGGYQYLDLDKLCLQNPSIPRPVPAIFSGEKGRGTLEKSLSNQMNTTNVYIRGLLPDTTDEMLHAYGVRFGDIVSAKAMLDQHTGLCKGFGFIKYHNFIDGENCIRGFFHWGYEAKWARVSHNERLKTLGDPDNTNLYVSNLPIDMNESGLKAIFTDFEVLSVKILRDPDAISRGVGFARFATSAICDKVIETFNGKPVGDEGATLNIRYADTEEQKKLKTLTAERRQFKTNEYNTVVYGSGSPFNVFQPGGTSFQSPVQFRAPGMYTSWPGQATSPTGYQLNPPYSTNFTSQTSSHYRPYAGPTNIRYNSRVKIETPTAAPYKKQSPSKKGDNVPSPADSNESSILSAGLGNLSLKTSPTNSSG